MLAAPARLVDTAGRELGEGQPFYRYTVGQRRGLGLAAKSPLYVLAIEPEENRVVVGEERDLLAPGLSGERLHWIGPAPEGEVEATVKIRSRHPGVAARIRSAGRGQRRDRLRRAAARGHSRAGRRLLSRHPRPGRLLDPGPAVSFPPLAQRVDRMRRFLLLWSGRASPS